MNIYTSYFANRKISDYAQLAISLSVPKGVKCARFLDFAPSWEILNAYKKTHDITNYVFDFGKLLESRGYINGENNNQFKLLIGKLSRFSELNDNKDVVLLCYEKSGDFCHRHLVAEYMNSVLGKNVVREL